LAEIILHSGDFFALRTANTRGALPVARPKGSDGPPVKKRIGDRRARGRFEVVGSLTGTLETTRRLAIRNIGPGGALLDSPVPLTLGSRLSGRLGIRGHGRNAEARVRHLTALSDRGGGIHYLVGLQWEQSTSVDDLVGTEPVKPAPGRPEGDERRMAPRMPGGADAEIGQSTWATVDVIDISTNGVLVASPVPMEIGEKGKLKMRLGDANFVAELEVRRSEPRKTPQGPHRVGAAFLQLDDTSRIHLEDFIGERRR